MFTKYSTSECIGSVGAKDIDTKIEQIVQLEEKLSARDDYCSTLEQAVQGLEHESSILIQVCVYRYSSSNDLDVNIQLQLGTLCHDCQISVILCSRRISN